MMMGLGKSKFEKYSFGTSELQTRVFSFGRCLESKSSFVSGESLLKT